MRLQKDLDDTKDILVSDSSMTLTDSICFHRSQKNTLVNVLERGEKIDDLVARSNDLNFEARAFYKTVS